MDNDYFDYVKVGVNLVIIKDCLKINPDIKAINKKEKEGVLKIADRLDFLSGRMMSNWKEFGKNDFEEYKKKMNDFLVNHPNLGIKKR